MFEDSLVYTFTLNYNPQPVGDSNVVRTSKAAVIVECHYPRKHNVSSKPLDPLWIPFSAVKVAEEFLYFTLRLMTDDWQYERPSYQYFLGDIINIEAAVKQFFHVPLRVYVDSCVATLSPEPNSNPRYGFIENHGCLIDARVTGSSSRFMARTAENKLQFQLEAFRWREASGQDGACSSCESGGFGSGPSSGGGSGSFGSGASLSNPGRKSRDVTQQQIQTEFLEWEGDVTLGPIPVDEKNSAAL
ncbi:hypothetical protein INR49_021593 [Caranx melampygus]|nr:hypothetical protein INR49_021593 [Caranx melampygus]